MAPEVRNFSLFVGIGLLKTVLTIALNGVLIDILGLPGVAGSVMTAALIFFGTYAAYVVLKVIRPRFVTYAAGTLGFMAVQVVMVSVLVDFAGLGGAVSSALVIGALFVIRYLFFRRIGLI